MRLQPLGQPPEPWPPEAMALVVVGDARVVTPQLEALGLGPVRVLEVEEFLGPAIQIPSAQP